MPNDERTKPVEAKEKSIELNGMHRFFIGGMAAMLPFLATTILVDKGAYTVTNFDLLTMLGIVARAALLFGIGGFITQLYSNENDKLKLFNIGMGAPALLIAVNTGANAPSHALPAPAAAESPATKNGGATKGPNGFLEFVTTAYAQPTKDGEKKAVDPGSRAGRPAGAKTIEPPEQTALDRFSRGFFGNYQTNSWYVTVGAYRTLQDAQQAARDIELKKKNPPRADGKFQKVPDFKTEVYQLPIKEQGYTVAVGQQMRWADAENLRNDIQDLGIAKQAELRNAAPASAK